METLKEEKLKRNHVVKDQGKIYGQWRLIYALVNPMGAGGFGGRLLANYDDPISGKKRVLVDTNNRALPGYWIDKVTTILDAKNPEEKIILDFLIGHPEVGIQNDQVNIDGSYMSKKNDNPRIKLVNLDYENVQQLDDEDFVDKLIGRIVLDGGPAAISLDRLRYLLAGLNMTYKFADLTKDPKREKAKLRQILKQFCRSTMDNAKLVSKMLEDLDNAKYLYEIKEAVDQGVMIVSNGMFKYNNVPLGISTESVIKYFQNDPDAYTEIVGKLK